jgi:DNA-binding transcriptional LysR family regulator
MKHLRKLIALAIVCLLLAAVAACDDPSTALVVSNDSGPSGRPLRVVVQLPDGSVDTGIVASGASMTFRSLFEGTFVVGAVIDPSYVQEYRRQRDQLLVQLGEIDLFAGDQAAEQREQVSRELTSMIDRVQDLSRAEGYAECEVELGRTGQVSAVVSMLADEAIVMSCN